ncbi:MAG: HNH endonuclease [Propionibacteriaceae bacterium]|nr:HNH endonuclease [Propionibacteriaceae bacterium]
MSASTIQRLEAAVRSEDSVGRFRALTHLDVAASSCVYWVGAVSERGHGRFWVGEGSVVIAHRFAWALAYGVEALRDCSVLAHSCDNPLCVNVEHLRGSTPWRNAREWSSRSGLWSGPLSDARGSRRRARAIRDGLRAGRPLGELLDEGRTVLERDQLALW